jgi:hypothetical protein
MKFLKKNCKICTQTVTPILRPGIGCCNCPLFFHFSCVNLDEQDINYIENNPVGWLCTKCNKPDKRNSITPRTPIKSPADETPSTSGHNQAQRKESKVSSINTQPKQPSTSQVPSPSLASSSSSSTQPKKKCRKYQTKIYRTPKEIISIKRRKNCCCKTNIRTARRR